jgi:hypothetical protein
MMKKTTSRKPSLKHKGTCGRTRVEAMTTNGYYSPRAMTELAGIYLLLEVALSVLEEEISDFSILTHSPKSVSEISLKGLALKSQIMGCFAELLRYAGMTVEDSVIFIAKCRDRTSTVSENTCAQIVNRYLVRCSAYKDMERNTILTSHLL